MLHPPKADVDSASAPRALRRDAPERAAKDAVRELRRLARPSGDFDARRYFRDTQGLGFYNVGTATMRTLARSIHAAHRDRWTIDDAMQFAERLVANRYLEVKAVGIEVVSRYHRDFAPPLLARWKHWLARNDSANWATTDHLCGALIGPALVRFPERAAGMRAWSRSPNMWVRRASIVSLIRLARQGQALDLVYEIAARLHRDREDLIQKAVGWTLREAGKADMPRLERYLLANGPSIPRTTLRYAIERFPPSRRAALLKETRHGR
jgi:3-methyladenine DNA glycosylase AlkD